MTIFEFIFNTTHTISKEFKGSGFIWPFGVELSSIGGNYYKDKFGNISFVDSKYVREHEIRRI